MDDEQQTGGIDVDAELEQAKGDYHTGAGEDDRFWGNAGAGALLRAKDTGRYLLLHRSRYVNEPNTWGMASGKIDWEDGELAPKDAAAREVREETGYSGPLALKLVDVFEHGTFRFYNYLGEVPSEFEPVFDWESDGYEWAEAGGFPEPLHFGLKRILHLFEGVTPRAFLSLFTL